MARQREYQILETPLGPFNKTMQVARYDDLPSGLVIPCPIARLSYDIDIENITMRAAEKGIALPDVSEMFLYGSMGVVEANDDPTDIGRRVDNIFQLKDEVTRFVAATLLVPGKLEAAFTESADEDEKQAIQAAATQTAMPCATGSQPATQKDKMEGGYL